MGAEAAPPTLAWLPTARKNTGALIRRATPIKRTPWKPSQIAPTANSSGRSMMAIRFMLMPIVATRT